MIHLTPADYTRMPWANGKGMTVELMRVNKPDGRLLWRLSMASVVEDGPFSIFPGVERNLTVISGPGFDLMQDGVTRSARPLVPVAFPGDVPVTAIGTGGLVSEDFNVMTDRTVPLPAVTVERQGITFAQGGTLCVFALDRACVNDHAIVQHDLILTDGPASITGQGSVIVVRLRI